MRAAWDASNAEDHERARRGRTAAEPHLQPKDGPHREKNTEAAVDYCLQNPFWRLSIQTHKNIGIP